MRRCLNCMKEYQEQHGEVCPYCGYVEGATQSGEVALRPGSILKGRFIVGTVIRARDTDIIYHGWDALFDRRVRLQEYFPRYCATRSSKPELSIYDAKQERYEAGLKLFYDQNRELIRLYKEPEIITCHACFYENKTAYAVFEDREDQTLTEWLDGRRIDEDDALALLREAAYGLELCHRLGIYHGRIGTDSFWISDTGLVLKDFCSWRYISGEPGIVDYGTIGANTDVYGLASLFCRMVTGKEVEDGEDPKTELLFGTYKLKKEVVSAIRHALSRDTKTLSRFLEELEGRRHQEIHATFVRNQEKRRDARNSLEIPKWVFAAAGCLVASALGFAVLTATGVIHLEMKMGKSQIEKNQVRVPNVVNKTVGEAERLLKRDGLEINKDKMVYSDEIPENVVSYQNMKENTLVDENTKIVVWISKGREKAVVPAVTGLSKEKAEQALTKAGFQNIRVEESMEPGKYDSVLAISAEEGSNTELAQEIVLTVCVNQENQEGDTSVQIAVANVGKMNRQQAEQTLTEAGFKVSWVETFSDQPEGTILSQEPAAGTEANKGSYVTVHISKGAEKVYMKNVELETLEDAKRILEELGLTVGTTTEEYSDSVAEGKVISQSIKLDTEVEKGDPVDLVISKGRDPAKVEAERKAQEAAAAAAERKAAEKKRQEEAAKKAAAEASRQAAEAAAAEASRQAAEAVAAEASRQAAEAAAAEASRQAAETAAGEEPAAGSQTLESGSQGSGNPEEGAVPIVPPLQEDGGKNAVGETRPEKLIGPGVSSEAPSSDPENAENNQPPALTSW